ncbi:hypothetical protein CTA2_13019 [Colletotrichum tanaceti]|uniref:Rhodopsin domain-containing protein n=1 Tax=Colletotrichum tanaceti TaxID=1306861 RepID=A0A4U6XJS9_9PEZI|nr:hypothetical protein CTA2_13019 [Colletotrichum tanaceti]TKW55712.1 hypothetical protein CTA1_9853 [Colletotrichum tanaceti]
MCILDITGFGRTLAGMHSLSSAYYPVLPQQPASSTSNFNVPDSANLSSWTMPPCFAPCLHEWCGRPSAGLDIINDTACICTETAETVFAQVEDECLENRSTCGSPDFWKAEVGSLSNYWPLNFGNINTFTKVNIAFNIACTVSLGLAKISIAFFFLQIFNTSSARFKRFIWATIIFTACLTCAFILGQFLMCNRVSCLWDNSGAPWQGCKCNYVWQGEGVYPALNAALDVWFVLLPATQIIRTRWHWKQKFLALAMFSLGLIACIPFTRVLIVRKISPYLSELFARLSATSKQLSSSQQITIRPRNSAKVDVEEASLSPEDGSPPIMDVGGLLAAGNDSQDDVSPKAKIVLPPPATLPSQKETEMLGVAGYVANAGDGGGGRVHFARPTMSTDPDPAALRQYGFISKSVNVRCRSIAWDGDNEISSAKSLEADRRSL